jgi:hypothetical protein
LTKRRQIRLNSSRQNLFKFLLLLYFSVTRGLLSWRTAVETATNTSQLALAYQQLESSIAWDKSIMKARCQFCHGEQDEDALLLCDSCDKAFHMYCFKPELESVPDGDWYCWECVNKATGNNS